MSPSRTKKELVEEISALRKRVRELELREREYRHTEETLLRSEMKFRTLYDATGDAVMLADEKGFLDCNEAALAVFGCESRERFCSMHPGDLSPPFQPCGTESITLSNRRMAAALEKGRVQFEWVHKRADTGETFLADVLLTAVVLDGKPFLQAVVRDITERRRIEETLRKERDFSSTMIETSPAFLVAVNSDGTIRVMNNSTLRMLGYTLEEVTGKDCLSTLIPHGDRERLLGVISDLMVRVEPTLHENRVLTKDGRELLVEWNGRAIRKPDGSLDYFFGIGADITERKKIEMRLKESEERYRTAIEHSNDGVALDKGGRNVFINRKFLDIFGYESLEDFMQGEEHREAHPDDRERVVEYARRRQQGEPAPSRYEYKGIRKDGTVIYIEASVAMTFFEGEPASLAYLRDVTERREMEERLKAMTTTDELTGLYNRRGFLTLAQQQLKLAERTGKGMELFFIDLDGMKQINDTLGHREGDRALVDVSAILRQTFRKSDIIGRMGGDEFAALAIDTDHESRESLMERLDSILHEFNTHETGGYRLSLSVGTALFEPGDSLDELIARADDLMYQEKNRKKQRI